MLWRKGLELLRQLLLRPPLVVAGRFRQLLLLRSSLLLRPSLG